MIENYLKKRRLFINAIHGLRQVNKRYICCLDLSAALIAKKAWRANLPEVCPIMLVVVILRKKCAASILSERIDWRMRFWQRCKCKSRL